MNCKDCIHKTMCKYTESFLTAEKKMNDDVKTAVKELPNGLITATLSVECTMFAGEISAEPVKEEVKVEKPKRHRRTKAEMEAEKTEPVKEDVKAEVKEEKAEPTPEAVAEPVKEEVNAEEPVKDEKPEEVFTEIKEEKKSGNGLDEESKKNLLAIGVEDFLFNVEEDVLAEVKKNGFKTVKDFYNSDLRKNLSAKSLEAINRNLKDFRLDTF